MPLVDVADSMLYSGHPHHTAKVSSLVRGYNGLRTLVLTVCFSCRLQEGYHVTSADNGVVTLAAQLTVQVRRDSSTP